ncbi:MAG: hypothetical protein L0H23_11775, partial [Luteimonas sp.]|nr:hypothetical protein [Luteimonas sp.]
MFINCPLCKALVATDPATDLPPEHCPRCAAKLREVQLDARVDAASGTSPGDDPAAIATPPLDPAPLLHAPPPDAPFPDGPGSTAPSELSS